MQKYLARRLVLAFVTLLSVSVILFILSRVSGDPRHIYLDDYSTQEDWDRMGVVLGLDKPYYQQYALFIKDAVRGDFGTSVKEHRPVLEIIIERAPATLLLGFTAFALSLLVGVPLGIMSAVTRGRFLDQFGKLVALIGQSAPPFWLGIMLMFFFAVWLRWTPPYGSEDWNSIILPAVTLGWYYAAANLRLVRSAMLDVLDSEYIKLARAKGVNPSKRVDAVRGDFGTAVKEHRPVLEIIIERAPATLLLGFTAFALSLLVGVPLGIMSAVTRGRFLDQFGKLVALIGQSAPPFWLGIMLMFFFAVWLRWTPPYGSEDWNSIILPAVTLGWYYAAANLRLVRSAMLDVLDSEYIKLARAKGVTSTSVVLKHGLRNALIPPLTFAGVTLGALVTGSLVVETVFAWPGLGRLAIESLFSFDYPLLQGVVITFTLMYVTAAFVVDILYAYVDPRIRFA